jgi:TfoX/Sxy family transcriptional regulator of competence genes
MRVVPPPITAGEARHSSGAEASLDQVAAPDWRRGRRATRRGGAPRPNHMGRTKLDGWLSAAVSYDESMAYDEQLADRIRELVGREADLTERKMFGGLAFLIGGNMAVAASGQGGVLVRVDPAQSDALVATTNARLMEMRGRQMQGWLRVSPEDLRTKRQLARWVEFGMSYARSLPTKR